ncbi:BBX27 [Arabidopsis thaliana]|uniref:BBX27 n=2 Tax=Arabidopsis TaxID=3701 RepID=A0A178WAV8_ARATH|nr:BBX27 [Arabidopsis thaliana]
MLCIIIIENMERVCEFCKAYRAVVYCIADTANLCLTCDAKVHSANSLSGRHLRTVLCDSCKNQPCVVRCFDHKMFLCHGCNDKFHGGGSSEHRRRDLRCYTGCPPAKDFAVMWGFRVMDDDDDVSLEQSFRMVKPKVQREGGFILEQILELEKVQLREENGSSSLTERGDPSPLELPKEPEEQLIDLPQTGKELVVDFSHLSSSSTLGDSFWECKSPYNKNNQLWHQNIQDIGVCEDTICSDDDFQIPDIDLTFRNFEEQFGADPEPIADSNNVFFVSSLDKSHEMKTFSSSFNNPIFAPKPASSTISFSSSETDNPYSHSEEVISFCPPLSNNTRQKVITRLKEKKRARVKEKKA